MNKISGKITVYIKKFFQDSLHINSYILMANSFSLAFFGFIFWSLAAKLYTPEDVGLASTMVSFSILLVNLANLGLSIGLIRYLPNATKPDTIINSSLNLIIVASVVLSAVFLPLINLVNPELTGIFKNHYYLLVIILLIFFWGIANLLDTIFLSLKETTTVLIKNLIFSLLKLPLLLILTRFQSMGLVIGITFAYLLTCIIYYFFILPKHFVGYKYRFLLDIKPLKEMFKFSLLNHFANIIGSLPVYLLPLIILSVLGPAYSGYYYLTYNMANLLYFISLAYSMMFFVEGSYNEGQMQLSFLKAFKASLLLTIIGIGFLFLIGGYLLSFFGKEYLTHSLLALRYFALASLPMILVNLTYSYLRIRLQMKEIFILSSLSAVLTIIMSLILIQPLKLSGIGLSWLISYSLTAVFCLIMGLNKKYFNTY